MSKICEICNKEHDGNYGSGRFCSKSCANTRIHSEETKQKIQKKLTQSEQVRVSNDNCLYCGKKLKIRYNKFCSNKCQHDYQYGNYINNWKQGIITGETGNDWRKVSGHIRRYIFEKYNNKCCLCGWSEINIFSNSIPLEIDHIDGDSNNNNEDNLRLICPNCHSLTKSYRGANRGNGREITWISKKKVK